MKNSMNTIVCYFRPSEKFSEDHVLRLQSAVQRNCSLPFQFLCLTPEKILGVSTLTPSLDLYGWWGKLELFFHSGITCFDNILYFDLDTAIVGNIDEFFSLKSPSFLEDFLEPKKLATGMMFWQGLQMDWMLSWTKMEVLQRGWVGDQGLVRYAMRYHCAESFFIQDQIPGVYSYKVHCKNGLPQDTKVVCFHGRPWIQDVKEKWMEDKWVK